MGDLLKALKIQLLKRPEIVNSIVNDRQESFDISAARTQQNQYAHYTTGTTLQLA